MFDLLDQSPMPFGTDPRLADFDPTANRALPGQLGPRPGQVVVKPLSSLTLEPIEMQVYPNQLLFV